MTADRFDPAEWDRLAAGVDGGDGWIFARSVARACAAAEAGAADAPGATADSAPGLWIDIGTGTGRAAFRLAAPGRRVVGVDRDPAMLRRGGERMAASPPPGEVLLVAARGERLPFADRSARRIVAVSFLGCLESPEEFLAEAHRVLAPGGRLVLTATNRRSLLLRLNYLLPRRWVSPRGAAAGPTRFRLYRAAELAALLARAGFRVDRPRVYNFALHAGPWLLPPPRLAARLDILDRLPGAASWGRNLLVTAERPPAAG